MAERERYFRVGHEHGCPQEQLENFDRAEILLQPRQMVASAAARLCDAKDGPSEIGYGGARGGGKSHWLLAQMGADDCQRAPGLKCLLLRKVGKANTENFNDFRLRLFRKLPHEFAASTGVLTFDNGSRIVARHFQHEKDIDGLIGLEYDVIGIEEATTLTASKYTAVLASCRTSRGDWRPRIYSTTNPGNAGHEWYKARFVLPHRNGREVNTRFIPATVRDNAFVDESYLAKLDAQQGVRLKMWRDGDWDINAGQFFTTFRHEAHVIREFDERRASEWFAAMDWGYTHPTVVLLGCVDGSGTIFVVDEHAERNWLPAQHGVAIRAMLERHNVTLSSRQAINGHHSPKGKLPRGYVPPILQRGYSERRMRTLGRFVAGTDVFCQSGGLSVAMQYAQAGVTLQPANMDRINGWAAVLNCLGDPGRNVMPRLFIHARCARLIECLPTLQRDERRPEDVMKVDVDEDGNGGDDAADALRYLVGTRGAEVRMGKLTGM